MPGPRHQLARLHPAELGERAVGGFVAPDALARRQHRVAAVAFLVVAVVLVAVDHHLVADLPAPHLAADRPHDAAAITMTSTSSLSRCGVGTISCCMAVLGSPWRSRRITQAYMFLGTSPSGGISPISYRSLPAAGTGSSAGCGAAPFSGMICAPLVRPGFASPSPVGTLKKSAGDKAMPSRWAMLSSCACRLAGIAPRRTQPLTAVCQMPSSSATRCCDPKRPMICSTVSLLIAPAPLMIRRTLCPEMLDCQHTKALTL